MNIQMLWDRLHVARENGWHDAAYAYAEAVAQFYKGNVESADWWRLQGDLIVADLASEFKN